MQLARFLVETVVLGKQSANRLVREYPISRSWFYELLARYRRDGPAALEPRSHRPRSCPHKVQILNLIDDHSRLCLGSVAVRTREGCGRPPDLLFSRRGVRVADQVSQRQVATRSGCPRVRARPSGHSVRALDPLSPPDLRQGGTLPPDPQALPRQAGSR